MQMCAFRFFETTVCISVLFVAVAIAQTQEAPPSGIFEWCKRAECVDKRAYMRFFKIEDFQNVNTSVARWDIHLGLWSSSFRLFILLSERPRRIAYAGQYYEYNFGVLHPNLPEGQRFSQLSIRDGNGNVEVKNIMVGGQPWLLRWKDIRPFVIRLIWGNQDTGQTIAFVQATTNRVLFTHQNIHTALNISYIAFASANDRESKIFFDCPLPRYGNVQFIPKNPVPRLGHVEMPTCRPDLCDQCPLVYLPVCSTEHKTYRNECFFRCQQPNTTIKVLHKGLCMHWLWQM
ncbi:uncharacterized protein LOC133531725 isoform X1 [Cydia pomonella]|uniref:uncharacterized protein LOC133531725 isoform X1 n=1 Tax=Cydia pomonella TaxID=82600 RepID=UPI002ADDBBAE|nr:uncharacterized protein LOC133531725 isoform X1 [Cydia pomonella]